MPEQLRERWHALWQRVGAKGDPDPVYADLVVRYGEDHRRYHNLRHVSDCLAELDTARYLCQEPDAVEMAIWYHDAVYYPRVGGNEEESAKLALEVISKASLPGSFGRKVAALILATKHQAAPQGADEQLIADIDLAIFGQSQLVFDRYERQIRIEYARVAEADFAAGRSAILESFQQRDYIYATAFFREKYEEKARRNLERSIAALAKTRNSR